MGQPRSPDWQALIDQFGLRVYCPKCSVRGRFFPNAHGHRHRLREVRCDRLLSDGETVCGGRFKQRPTRDGATWGQIKDWPNRKVSWYSTGTEFGTARTKSTGRREFQEREHPWSPVRGED